MTLSMGTPGSPDTSRYQADETGEIVTSWALHTRLAHSYWGVDRDRMDAASGETPDVWAIVNEDGEKRTLRRIDDELALAEVEPDIYVDVGVPMGSDAISVTLTAKEKAGRYYAESTIRHLVAECDGTLFWDDRQHLHILRTRRENARYDYVCLLLAIEEEGVTVINQTTDHYDWDTMDPVKTPVGPIGDRDVTSVEGETRTVRPGADVGDEGGA